MKNLMCAFVLAVILLAAHSARAADLAITVTGIDQARGVIRVILIADPNGNAHQSQSRNVDTAASKDGALTTSFIGLAPGLYGVVVLEDKPVNHAIEKAVTGTVGAPMATSSEVRVTLAEPKTAVSIPLTPTR